MTDSNSSLNEVPALLDERRRYEGWLAALDARRESTPGHVFERVQADYRSRLERVAEQLSSHRHAIEEERGSVQARLSLLAAEERLRRDERAELDLRSHVGELAGEEAERAFGGVDEAIGQLVTEKGGLESRIAELQALLDEEARPVHAGNASVAEPVAEVPAPEPVVVAPVEAPVAAAAPVESPVVATTHEPENGKASPPPADGGNGAPPRPASGSFDELAFLSSIVGKSAEGAKPADGPLVERRNTEPLLRAPAGVAQEELSAESLLAGVENAKLATGEHPLAANIAGNAPIVLRPTASTEQAKTLKCNECGAMNYPTEWYCERCGAELAAL